jgi:hypothetical protein
MGAMRPQWHSYEILADSVQLAAMELIESNILNPGEEFAGLFMPEPQSD